MPHSLKQSLRLLLPPIVANAYLARFRAVRYVGNYSSWQEAKARSSGYDAPNIIMQVAAAARKARDGEVAFERDGVTFDEPSYNWPLLACFFREAHRHGGALRVLDYGGSLASIYFQHRRWFRGLDVKWAVVEQTGFVDIGRREFASGELSFHEKIEDAIRAIQPTVALFSGVLAWLEHPQVPLGEIVEAGIPAIIIDRTPLSPLDHDVVKVQHVPPSIYRASYPCWFLSRRRFMEAFESRYRLESELPQHDPAVKGVSFAGLYFTIKR